MTQSFPLWLERKQSNFWKSMSLTLLTPWKSLSLGNRKLGCGSSCHCLTYREQWGESLPSGLCTLASWLCFPSEGSPVLRRLWDKKLRTDKCYIVPCQLELSRTSGQILSLDLEACVEGWPGMVTIDLKSSVRTGEVHSYIPENRPGHMSFLMAHTCWRDDRMYFFFCYHCFFGSIWLFVLSTLVPLEQIASWRVYWKQELIFSFF